MPHAHAIGLGWGRRAMAQRRTAIRRAVIYFYAATPPKKQAARAGGRREAHLSWILPVLFPELATAITKSLLPEGQAFEGG